MLHIDYYDGNSKVMKSNILEIFNVVLKTMIQLNALNADSQNKAGKIHMNSHRNNIIIHDITSFRTTSTHAIFNLEFVAFLASNLISIS